MRKQTGQYNKDFYAWAMTQADLLKQGKFDRIDFTNIAEEIESLGRSDKKSLRSHLYNLLKHMLKIEVQPEKLTSSWNETIINSKVEIKYSLEDSPSLKPFIKEIFPKCYEDARHGASAETGINIKKFPKECPWTLKEVLK